MSAQLSVACCLINQNFLRVSVQYTCLICNLFDDEDKSQFHCYLCGICRVGGRGRFFHCQVCNMCLPLQLKTDGHRVRLSISTKISLFFTKFPFSAWKTCREPIAPCVWRTFIRREYHVIFQLARISFTKPVLKNCCRLDITHVC